MGERGKEVGVRGEGSGECLPPLSTPSRRLTYCRQSGDLDHGTWPVTLAPCRCGHRKLGSSVIKMVLADDSELTPF